MLLWIFVQPRSETCTPLRDHAHGNLGCNCCCLSDLQVLLPRVTGCSARCLSPQGLPQPWPLKGAAFNYSSPCITRNTRRHWLGQTHCYVPVCPQRRSDGSGQGGSAWGRSPGSILLAGFPCTAHLPETLPALRCTQSAEQLPGAACCSAPGYWRWEWDGWKSKISSAFGRFVIFFFA